MRERQPFHRALDAVLTYGATKLDQHDVAELSGTSDATVSKACKELRHGHGPLLLPTPVRFSPQLGLVLAMSIGSESARAGIVDANGQVYCEHSATPLRDQLKLSPSALLSRIREQAALALREAIGRDELCSPDGSLPLLSAAFAVAAPADRDHRLVGSALTHPDWGERDPEQIEPSSPTLNERLAAALGNPFTPDTAQVMNDCNAGVVALAFERVREVEELRYQPQDLERERTTALLLRVSGGIGLGMVEIAGDKDDPIVSRFLKSRVMVGTNGLAGEIGHVPVSPSAVKHLNDEATAQRFHGLAAIDGETECACGRPRHLQALAGGEAVARRLNLDVDNHRTTITDLLDKYLHPPRGEKDKNAERALADAGKLIGRVLTGTVLTLDPHAITVTGPLGVPALVEGLSVARREWGDAFWTGRSVEFDPLIHESHLITLRGAGLSLIRAHRHRKLREIGAGKWDGLRRLLPYRLEPLDELESRCG